MTSSSKIEQIMDEIEEYIANCKPRLLSNTEIIVNKEEIEDLLQELRRKTPLEIQYYQNMVSNREAILQEARDKAEALINEATIHTSELVEEHEIMQQAYAQANEIVTMASNKAQEILDNATMEANAVRTAAMQYMDDMLEHLEKIITASSQSATSNFESLIGSLNQYRDVIQSNRRELHPEEELENVFLDEDTDGEDGIDVIS